MRILLVDDDDDVREYTAYVLEEAGYIVHTAARPEAAMAMLRTGQPVDLLVTDVVMPGCDGLELARRALEARPTLRVLYTTGYTRHILPERLAGAEVLDKPYMRSALLHAVDHVLSGRGMRAKS